MKVNGGVFGSRHPNWGVGQEEGGPVVWEVRGKRSHLSIDLSAGGREILWDQHFPQRRADSCGSVLATLATCPSWPSLKEKLVLPLGWSNPSQWIHHDILCELKECWFKGTEPVHFIHRPTLQTIDSLTTRVLESDTSTHSLGNDGWEVCLPFCLFYLCLPAVSKVAMRSSRGWINRRVSVHLADR